MFTDLRRGYNNDKLLSQPPLNHNTTSTATVVGFDMRLNLHTNPTLTHHLKGNLKKLTLMDHKQPKQYKKIGFDLFLVSLVKSTKLHAIF